MKSCLIFLIAFLFLIPHNVSASHGSGGEVTWECLPNGQYKFRLFFYRDCNGIPAPNSINLNTTVPGVPVISMPLIQQIDISPQGYFSDGVTLCNSCSSGSGIYGVIQKNVYESNPVTLSGVPPQAGWSFYWGECCLSGAVTNVQNPGSTGFRYRAVMYPYQGQNMNPCFDSSPFFVESPRMISCSGFENSFSFFASDPERDSLRYFWGEVLNEMGGVVTHSPGYSQSSPLPSTTQNPANVNAVLDPGTGLITHLSFTGGRFVLSGKVAAYKCGIKVSEVFRTMIMSVENNCPALLSGLNNPPLLSAPFVNPYTGLQVDYADTVVAGERVDFNLTFSDFDFFQNSGIQQIQFESYSSHFGTNYVDSTAGCDHPPCAVLNVSLPVTVNIAGQVNFSWQTTCGHIFAQSLPCGMVARPYYFLFKASDNYCPANGNTTRMVSIVVKPSIQLNPPVIRCASVNPDGSVNLTWTPSTSNDSLGNFRSYRIFAAASFNGTYQLIDSVTSGIGATTFQHTASAINNIFGGTANEKIIYYKIATGTYCSFPFIPDNFSNIMANLKLNVDEGTSHLALLNWQAPAFPSLSSHSGYYRIFKEYPLGNWTMLDSTTSTSWADFSVQALCNDSVSYRIEMADSTGCTLISSVAGTVINDPASVAAITPPAVSICPGQNTTLTASPGISYQWSNGANTQSVTVNTAGTYTVTVTQASGCSGSATATVNFIPAPVPVITGVTVLCQGQNTVLNAGPGWVAYLWSTGAISQSINIGVGGIYTVTVTDPCGSTGSSSVTVTVNPLPNVLITANGPVSFCQGDSVQLIPSPSGGINYLWYRFSAPIQPQPLTQWYYAKTRGAYYCVMTDANGCSGSSNSIQVNVPCIQVGPSHEKEPDVTLHHGARVYPNPASRDFYIESDQSLSNEVIRIYNQTGKLTPYLLHKDSNHKIRISGLDQGLYLLRIGNENGYRILKVLIME